MKVVVKFFKYKYLLTILTLNLIFFLFAISVIVAQEIKASKTYLSSSFQNFNHAIQSVGENNLDDLRQIQAVIDKSITFNHPISLIQDTKIFENETEGSFGFNYNPKTLSPANGTLFGLGTLPESLKTGQERFLILDKIWSYYDNKAFFEQHYYISFKLKYIYTSEIYKDLKENFNITESMFSPEYNRQGLDGIYQKELKDYGYFFSLPVVNQKKDMSTISVVTPVYKGHELIGDLAVRFNTNVLNKILSIYPDLQDYIHISLLMRGSNEVLSITKPSTSFFPVFSYEYKIDNLGILTAEYDVMFFVNKIFSGAVILFLVMILFNILIYIRRQNDIEQKMLKDELLIEPMTGLYNRRVIDIFALKSVSLTHSSGKPVSVLAFDAAKFKQINDTYGHQVGDEAILHITDKLKSNVRSSDFCIRMGGDEFLIIMPGAHLEKAQLIANNIQHDISTNPIKNRNVYVNVTYAVCAFHQGENFDDVYKKVDDLLYQNKQYNMTNHT